MPTSIDESRAVQAVLLLKRVQHQKSLALDATLGAVGSTIAQWSALRSIQRHPGLNSHALAALAFQTDQSFGAVLSKLAMAGLIERVPGPRKSLTHFLTPGGESLLRATEPLVESALEDQLSPLNEQEVENLITLLSRLARD